GGRVGGGRLGERVPGGAEPARDDHAVLIAEVCCALSGRNELTGLVPPGRCPCPQGVALAPRALPWAILLDPFGVRIAAAEIPLRAFLPEGEGQHSPGQRPAGKGNALGARATPRVSVRQMKTP